MTMVILLWKRIYKTVLSKAVRQTYYGKEITQQQLFVFVP